jgi:hypothetical protein
LSALSEKREVEYRKFREALADNADGNPEPSSDVYEIVREGAETRHGMPKVSKRAQKGECKKMQ